MLYAPPWHASFSLQSSNVSTRQNHLQIMRVEQGSSDETPCKTWLPRTTSSSPNWYFRSDSSLLGFLTIADRNKPTIYLQSCFKLSITLLFNERSFSTRGILFTFPLTGSGFNATALSFQAVWSLVGKFRQRIEAALRTSWDFTVRSVITLSIVTSSTSSQIPLSASAASCSSFYRSSK